LLFFIAFRTLALAETVQVTLTSSPNPIALAGWACLLAGLAFKLSLAPAHLWTPDVYQGAPAPVTAFLSAGSKGATILLFLLLLPAAAETTLLRAPLWGLAFFSMLIGNLAALPESRPRLRLTPPSPRHMSSLPSLGQERYVAAAYYAIAAGHQSCCFTPSS
jgi:NADH-quinone oxidoreductase subunit N